MRSATTFPARTRTTGLWVLSRFSATHAHDRSPPRLANVMSHLPFRKRKVTRASSMNRNHGIAPLVYNRTLRCQIHFIPNFEYTTVFTLADEESHAAAMEPPPEEPIMPYARFPSP